MPRILFIAAHRPGRSPSQRFRYEQYFEYLKENGFECDYSYLIPEKDDARFYSPGNYLTKFRLFINGVLRRMNDVFRASSYDIIFVQREAFMTGSAFFERKFSKSDAKFVFDFDDAIWLHDVSSANKALGWLKKPDKVPKIIAMADLVFAGNAYLANYALEYNQNVKVIPTTIDTSYHKEPSTSVSDDRICIGWTGTLTTLKHFQLAIPALEKIKEKYGNKVSFKVIVDVPYSEDKLDIVADTWKMETEIEDLSKIDIGIMPLPDDPWANGKCGFKGLQYMALEIPCVMSPVGVNKEIVTDGINGFLAAEQVEWVKKISDLIDSGELRKSIGKAARQRIIERYSVESQKNNYLKYFNEVIEK